MRSIKIIIVVLWAILGSATLVATCRRPDHQHGDNHVVRCTYTQKDLKRILEQENDRYESDKCFYCGCPIEEHGE